MHYFATTKSPNNIYNILVNSCKKDAEKKLNKSLTIFQINLNKQIPSLRFIIYFLKIFFIR